MKKYTIELDEREMDHVLLSLESSIMVLHNHGVGLEETDLPHFGNVRALNRFKDIHEKFTDKVLE